jgi:hypothetical protein
MKATSPSSGAGFTLFAPREATHCLISNVSGAVIEIQQGGSGEVFPLPDQQTIDIYGITNMNQLGVRAKTPAALDVYARWDLA